MTAPNFGETLERAGFKTRTLRNATTIALNYSNKTHDQHGRPMFQHCTYSIATLSGLVTVDAYREGRFIFGSATPPEVLGKRSFVTGLGWRLHFSVVVSGVLVTSKEVPHHGPVLRDSRVANFATKFGARAVELVMERSRA